MKLEKGIKYHMISLRCRIQNTKLTNKTKPNSQIQRTDWWLSVVMGAGVGKRVKGVNCMVTDGNYRLVVVINL